MTASSIGIFTRTRIVVLLTVGIVAIAGAAFAWWSTTGSGTGNAASGDVAAVTVVQTSSVTGLAPGIAAKTLSGNFNNPNGGPVYITSVTASITSVTKAIGAPSGTCAASDYTLTDPVMTVGAEVPAGSSQGTWTGAKLAFNNKASNQDACKGATVSLSYSAS